MTSQARTAPSLRSVKTYHWLRVVCGAYTGVRFHCLTSSLTADARALATTCSGLILPQSQSKTSINTTNRDLAMCCTGWTNQQHWAIFDPHEQVPWSSEIRIYRLHCVTGNQEAYISAFLCGDISLDCGNVRDWANREEVHAYNQAGHWHILGCYL